MASVRRGDFYAVENSESQRFHDQVCVYRISGCDGASAGGAFLHPSGERHSGGGDDNELLGIVSEGDLLYKKVTPKIPQYVDVLGGNLYYCGFGRYEKSFRKLLATTAAEIMTKDVRCVTPDTDMETVTTLMVDEHLKTVPVVEKKKIDNPNITPPARLVGIITRHDILGAIAATEAEELFRSSQQEKKEADAKEKKDE